MDNIVPNDLAGHFKEDVWPFITCCKAEFLNNCEIYYEFRRSDDCSRTRSPPPGKDLLDVIIVVKYRERSQCVIIL